MDETLQRRAMLAQLEGALDLAERLGETNTAYLIERALDEARSKGFSGLAAERCETIN